MRIAELDQHARVGRQENVDARTEADEAHALALLHDLSPTLL